MSKEWLLNQLRVNDSLRLDSERVERDRSLQVHIKKGKEFDVSVLIHESVSLQVKMVDNKLSEWEKKRLREVTSLIKGRKKEGDVFLLTVQWMVQQSDPMGGAGNTQKISEWIPHFIRRYGYQPSARQLANYILTPIELL